MIRVKICIYLYLIYFCIFKNFKILIMNISCYFIFIIKNFLKQCILKVIKIYLMLINQKLVFKQWLKDIKKKDMIKADLFVNNK